MNNRISHVKFPAVRWPHQQLQSWCSCGSWKSRRECRSHKCLSYLRTTELLVVFFNFYLAFRVLFFRARCIFSRSIWWSLCTIATTALTVVQLSLQGQALRLKSESRETWTQYMTHCCIIYMQEIEGIYPPLPCILTKNLVTSTKLSYKANLKLCSSGSVSWYHACMEINSYSSILNFCWIYWHPHFCPRNLEIETYECELGLIASKNIVQVHCIDTMHVVIQGPDMYTFDVPIYDPSRFTEWSIRGESLLTFLERRFLGASIVSPETMEAHSPTSLEERTDMLAFKSKSSQGQKRGFRQF